MIQLYSLLQFYLSLFLLLIFSFTSFSQTWELQWSDEFDGPTLDQKIWNIEVNNLGGYNNELQYYTNRSENIRIEDGVLVIEARKENYIDRNYTSARINSAGKKSFKYGKMEARMKLPYGNGIWPAFWMLGDNGNWPASGEIDIMELVGGTLCGYECGDNKTHGYIWYSDANNEDKHKGTMAPLLTAGIYADDYHTFSIEWDETSIKWFVDNNQFHSENISTAEFSEFHDSFYFLLNIAVGGDWPKNPNENTIFPQKMYIDYVRVYEKSDIVLTQEPYNGIKADIPGVIQTENYDLGGQDIAYNDNEIENKGNAYRADGVDIEENGNGGYNIGYVAVGEWLEYTVNVSETATYNITSFVANGENTVGDFHLEINGEIIGEHGTVPNTGGWTNWTEIQLGQVLLTKGEHIIRLVVDETSFNIDEIEFSTTNITSINNTLKKQNIVYPNPTKSQLTINVEHKISLNNFQLFDALGQQISNIIIEGENKLNVSNLTPGLYTIEIQQDNNRITETFLKQ